MFGRVLLDRLKKDGFDLLGSIAHKSCPLGSDTASILAMRYLSDFFFAADEKTSVSDETGTTRFRVIRKRKLCAADVFIQLSEPLGSGLDFVLCGQPLQVLGGAAQQAVPAAVFLATPACAMHQLRDRRSADPAEMLGQLGDRQSVELS
jgi:hypothetical protein